MGVPTGGVGRENSEEECLWLSEREAEPGQYRCPRSRQRAMMPDVTIAQGPGSRQRVMMPDAEMYATWALLR